MTLNLFENALEGTIPNNFTNFPYLTLLDFEVNSLTGIPFIDLTGTTNLKSFRVSFNRFVGAIPTSYGQLTNLQEFWISHNNIAGPIPTEFGNLTKLGM